MKGVPGTCYYCTNLATQNVVWRKNQLGGVTRIVLPHCGCDFWTELQKNMPWMPTLHPGADFVFESLEPLYPQAKGDGTNVMITFRDSGTGQLYKFEISKRSAKTFADKIREAARHPQPGCTDADAHWHGHCGCE